MKKKIKYSIIVFFVAVTFFTRLYRNLGPRPPTPPGMIPSGGAPEPYVVVFTALLGSVIVWGLLEFLFWVFDKLLRFIRKK